MSIAYANAPYDPHKGLLFERKFDGSVEYLYWLNNKNEITKETIDWGHETLLSHLKEIHNTKQMGEFRTKYSIPPHIIEEAKGVWLKINPNELPLSSNEEFKQFLLKYVREKHPVYYFPRA